MCFQILYYVYFSYIPSVLCWSYILYVTTACQCHGRNYQSGSLRKMQSSTPRTRPKDSRSKIKRGKGTVQGQRTLDTHHCGTKQLYISNAKRSHGCIGNLNLVQCKTGLNNLLFNYYLCLFSIYKKIVYIYSYSVVKYLNCIQIFGFGNSDYFKNTVIKNQSYLA